MLCKGFDLKLRVRIQTGGGNGFVCTQESFHTHTDTPSPSKKGLSGSWGCLLGKTPLLCCSRKAALSFPMQGQNSLLTAPEVGWGGMSGMRRNLLFWLKKEWRRFWIPLFSPEVVLQNKFVPELPVVLNFDYTVFSSSKSPIYTQPSL